MSAANKVVVVLGATGVVGQGVTHKFLTEGKYQRVLQYHE